MSIKENPQRKEYVNQILRLAKSTRRKDGENTGRYLLCILYLEVYILFQFVIFYSYYLHVYLFICIW